jgi:predicted nucleic acid-binding protein
MAEYTIDPVDNLRLAVAHQLNAYDAQYLLLAQGVPGELWTLDSRLAAAAR